VWDVTPTGVYASTPAESRKAALYVLTVLPKDEGAEVLYMLGLIESLVPLGRGGWRDPVGRAVTPKETT